MSALGTEARGVVLRCPACGRKNRVAWGRVPVSGRCGACKEALPTLDRPIEIAGDDSFGSLLAESPVPVLIDFWAAWCGPCAMVAPELEKVAKRVAGRLLIAKVNTDDLPGPAQAFRIASIPTMVLVSGGREVGRTSGARPAEGILQFLDLHLVGRSGS
jgi:thioredoxin 2